MGPLKSMTINELQQIVNNTAFDYDIRIKADTEILRRERDWQLIESQYWMSREQKDGRKFI